MYIEPERFALDLLQFSRRILDARANVLHPNLVSTLIQTSILILDPNPLSKQAVDLPDLAGALTILALGIPDTSGPRLSLKQEILQFAWKLLGPELVQDPIFASIEAPEPEPTTPPVQPDAEPDVKPEPTKPVRYSPATPVGGKRRVLAWFRKNPKASIGVQALGREIGLNRSTVSWACCSLYEQKILHRTENGVYCLS